MCLAEARTDGMRLSEIITLLSAKVICGQDKLDITVEAVYAGDLMSDLLAQCHTKTNNKTLLITGLNNPQVIRTAEIMDVTAIVFVRGKQPHDEVLQLAKEKGVPLLMTKLPLYDSCGILYSAGLRKQPDRLR
jgi:predicted transcriptional regulator